MFKYSIHLTCFIFIISLLLVTSCGSGKWYSIEQEPAEPIANIRGGVFVTGEYIRSASILEIDDQELNMHSEQNFQIPIGMRKIKISCDEAKGSFDSGKFAGQSKTLVFEAKTEKNYRAWCKPYTHWWIEEMNTKKIVAGVRPEQ